MPRLSDMSAAFELDHDSNDQDEIEVTAKEVYGKLIEAWLNEKFAPELLESKIELVDCMLEQIRELEGKMTKSKDLVSSLQKIELERVKFVISSYLRARLQKIEDNVIHVLEHEPTGESKLSTEELKFAKSFADNMQNQFNEAVLHHMPLNVQKLEQNKNIPRPNLDAYILLKVNERQEQVLLDPDMDDPTDLEQGTQHILRYQTIASCLETSSVALI